MTLDSAIQHARSMPSRLIETFREFILPEPRENGLENNATSAVLSRTARSVVVPERIHLRRIFLSALVAGLMILGATESKADIRVTGTETVNGHVEFNYSGSVDLTGLSGPNSDAGSNGINRSAMRFGSPLSSFTFPEIDIPFSSIGGFIQSTATSGDAFYFNGVDPFFAANTGIVGVPVGYVSGSFISGNMVFQNHTFASLGINSELSPYTYVVSPSFTLTLEFFDLLVPTIASASVPDAPIEPTFFAANTAAIASAQTTGLNSIASTLNSVQNAAQNAVGDLNNRIFNARSGENGTASGVASTLDSGTSRYLNFAQNQNIDHRVALGLADGEEVDLVDTLSGAGHPLAMVGVPAVTGSAVIAVEGGSGKNSVTDKVVIEDVADTTFEVFTSFDYGYYDQDHLTRTVRGFESDTYAGSAGLEYQVTDWLVAGAAFTYVNSDTTSTANLGSSDLEGNLFSGYATLFHGNTYLDVLYSYGDFNNDISRNTLLGRTAYGDTESQSHNINLNLGHTIEVNEKFSFGPSAGLNYTTGEVDGYTERNGGLANLIYPDHDFESMIGRLGGYATFRCETGLGLLTNQLSAGWAHEFNPENGNVTASLETSPFALVTGNSARSIGGYTASEERAHAGTDWLEFGATTRLDIGNTGFNFELGYQGQFFRNNASGHFGSAKFGYEW